MSSMKLKSFEELKNTDLKGYCFYVDAWGMSMTSRNSYQPELWIVLEDVLFECTIARYNMRHWIKTVKKELVASSIANNPAIDSKTFENLIDPNC